MMTDKPTDALTLRALPERGASVPLPEPSLGLGAFGLDEESERVYRALLAHPNWDADDFVAHLEMELPVLEMVLDRLADRALVDEDSSAPVFRRAVHPELGFGALLAEQEGALLQRWDKTRQLRRHVIALADRYDARPSATLGMDGLERVVGVEAVRARLAGLARAATSEVDVFNGGPVEPDELVSASHALCERALEAGATTRIVCLESVRITKPAMTRATELGARGAQVRVAITLPHRLVLVDRSTALVPIDASRPLKGALVVTDPALVLSLCSLFDVVWRSAEPFGAAPRHRDVGAGVTAQEREMLVLLGDGCTDEIVARKLGISPRTVRRLVAGLMTRMNVRSRFQAGRRAAELGWISE